MPRLQDQRQHELRRLNDVLLRKRRLTKKRLGQVGCQPDNPVRYFDAVATLEFLRLKVCRRWPGNRLTQPRDRPEGP